MVFFYQVGNLFIRIQTSRTSQGVLLNTVENGTPERFTCREAVFFFSYFQTKGHNRHVRQCHLRKFEQYSGIPRATGEYVLYKPEEDLKFARVNPSNYHNAPIVFHCMIALLIILS